MNNKDIEIIYETPPNGKKCTEINLGVSGLNEKVTAALTRHNARRGYVYMIGSDHYLAILDSDKEAPNA